MSGKNKRITIFASLSFFFQIVRLDIIKNRYTHSSCTKYGTSCLVVVMIHTAYFCIIPYAVLLLVCIPFYIDTARQ